MNHSVLVGKHGGWDGDDDALNLAIKPSIPVERALFDAKNVAQILSYLGFREE